MLAQILHDLYVPRELLDGLPEDQKQLLFCKMREEQIRRYHEREEEELEQAAIRRARLKSKKKKKHVTFRLGADGKEWCSIMGESNYDEQLINKLNYENIQIDRHNQSRNSAGVNHTHPTKTDNYYTAHRDEIKQIEEISNNIQEARRLFERLESDTRRLVLNKESELFQQQKSPPPPPPPSSHSHQTDIIDESFYREIEERAKKAEQEQRETARRARDNFHRNSLQLNVCFDTDNQTTLLFQHPPLNLSNKITKEKNIQIELVNKKSSDIIKDIKKLPIEQESSPLMIIENYPSKPLLPLTREDIRQWFCTVEIPYGTFRSSNGQIYPWFHGLISRSNAEQILASKSIGSYLIRINEKIFGYALSYRASDHCRHLLIEVISTSKHDNNSTQQHAYRFLGGAKHELFTQLNQLIEKYSNTPIRSNSTDVLRYPCGQIDCQKPDYADLFINNDKQYESLYISLENTTSSAQSTTHL